MSNVLGDYNPTMYAQEALIQLEKALGMAFHVHRGYDKNPAQKGETISIRRPGTFTAQAMPISSPADIVPETITMSLDQWYGVVMALTDKELAYTTEQIVNEHLRPAGVALADHIDQALLGLYIYTGNASTGTDTAAVTDLTALRKVMSDLNVPSNPRTLFLNTEREADFLSLAVFHQASTSGDGDLAQRDGYLGKKFGFNIFASPNIKTHTPGTVVTGADQAGAVVGAHSKGSATLAVNSFAVGETLKAGDRFTIAGDTQKYTVTADITLAGGAGTLSISPALQVAVSGSEVVTVEVPTKTKQNIAFHKDAFALAMAPLSSAGNGAGAAIGVAEDPKTNLTLRARRWYEGKEAKVYWGLDVLYGVKCLNPNLAARYESI